MWLSILLEAVCPTYVQEINMYMYMYMYGLLDN